LWGVRLLDHLGDLVKMMVGQRLLDEVVGHGGRRVATRAHHMLLSPIAVDRRRLENPESPRFVDSLLT
jgi:hypothetical protein